MNRYRPGYDPFYGEYLGLRGPALIWVRAAESTDFWLEVVDDVYVAYRQHEKEGRGMAIVMADAFSRDALEERKRYLEGIYGMGEATDG